MENNKKDLMYTGGSIKVSDRMDETQIRSDIGAILSYVDEPDTFSSLVLYYFISKHLTTKCDK